MPSRAEIKSSMRARILAVARHLFYANGIQAVGVDRVAEEAGISNKTLYNHFSSKEDLIRAYLEQWEPPAPLADLPPAQRILAEFDRLERRFADHAYRGCPFVNAVAELAQPTDAIRRLALRYKERRREGFLSALVDAGVADPEAVATQLMLLVEGALATMLVQCDPRIARAARSAAATLLAAAGLKTSPAARSGH